MRLGLSLSLLLGQRGGGSSLLNGLVHYFKLDETSGTRYDSVGTAHLTDNNTVGFGTDTFWTNASGLDANFVKTAVDGWNNAGCASIQGFASGECYVEITTTADHGYQFVGLTNGDPAYNPFVIDYALYFQPNGSDAGVWESGANMGVPNTYQAGDVFRIGVEGSDVVYRKNGNVVYTSLTAPSYPLIVGASVYSQGEAVPAVTLSGTLVDVLPRAKHNNAANFVKTNNEYLSIDTFANDTTTDWSVSLWYYRIPPTDDWECLIGNDENDKGYGLYTVPNTGSLFYFVVRPAPGGVVFLPDPTPNAWHHVYAEVSGSTLRMSLDNGEPATGTVNHVPGTMFYLARRPGSGVYFNGLIDEVATWSRVLTDDERTMLYAAGAGKFYPF